MDATPSHQRRDLILDLIGSLQTLLTARVLRSQIDSKTRFRADLSNLGSKAGSGNFDIKSTTPLVELFVNNASNAEIWRAVFDLIALTKPETINATNCLRESHLRYATTM